MFTVDLYGRPEQGPTTARPTNPAPGSMYFDTTLGLLLVWDETRWSPCSISFGGTDDRPSASAVPAGTSFHHESSGAQYSDGAEWSTVHSEDNNDSSSSTSSTSSSSS